MFFRLKKSGERTYVQIVENKREGAAVRQSVIANLGRADQLAASGALASLIASGAKLTDQAWLGEEMEEKPAEALAPRCVKDLIEERLFERRRDLFTDLSAVFMDTTSLSFYGEGGETLGEHGYSKDYRPDLKQMILGLVVDGDGRPI